MAPQKCRWSMVQFPTMLDCFECFFDVWIFSVFRFQPWNFAAAYFFGGFTKSHKALRLNPTRGESLFIFRMNFLCFCKAPLNFPNKPYSYQRLRQRKMGYESSWKQGLFRSTMLPNWHTTTSGRNKLFQKNSCRAGASQRNPRGPHYNFASLLQPWYQEHSVEAGFKTPRAGGKTHG